MSNQTSQGVCPRCRHDSTDILALSPIAGVWSVFQCKSCLYTWRSSEPARRSDPEHYPAQFRMNLSDIAHVEEIPAVPR